MRFNAAQTSCVALAYEPQPTYERCIGRRTKKYRVRHTFTLALVCLCAGASFAQEPDLQQMKGKVQQQWGKLTNDDLDVVEGRRQELAGRLQQRCGYAKDEADRQIDSWLKKVQ